MILLVDLCNQNHPLSQDEFVTPIARIIKRCNQLPVVRHYTELSQEQWNTFDGIILCGTALKDIVFLRHTAEFRWLMEERIRLLAIGSGMQVLTAIYGGTIELDDEIGMTPIRIICEDPLLEGRQEFSAYELHHFSPIPPDCFQVLGVSSHCVQVIRHQSLPLYGVLFHPEVRNEWVIERFLHSCKAGMD